MINATPLRGALIGAGNVTEYQLRAWQRIPQASIVAIADPDLERAQARALEFNINIKHTYPGLKELLEVETGLDFVDIAAPPDAHLELIRLAAGHGLHINCQKPFAPSLADARAMIQASRDAGVALNVNENWRWRSWYRTVKQVVSAGQIGKMVYARFFSHNSGWIPGKDRSGHRLNSWPRMIVFDWGTHHIDVSRFLFGEPTSVYARMASLRPDLAGEERAIVLLAFDDLTVIVDLSYSSYAPQGVTNRVQNNVEDVRIEGDAGTILLVQDPDKGDLIRVTTADGEWEQPAYDCEPTEAYLNSYVAAQNHFVECLLNGTTPETHALDNYETLAITLAAYHASEQNQVVSIADYKEMD